MKTIGWIYNKIVYENNNRHKPTTSTVQHAPGFKMAHKEGGGFKNSAFYSYNLNRLIGKKISFANGFTKNVSTLKNNHKATK